MLASSSAGAYICLQCRSRASRHLLGLAANSPRHHRLSTHSRRSLTQTWNLQDVGGEGVAAEKLRSRSNRRVYVHGRIRGKKGGEVREVTEVLPQGALGQPAEVIILKDAGIKESNHKTDAEIHSPAILDVVSSQSAVLKSIRGGAKLADEETVAASIEQMRDRVLQESLQRRGEVTEGELDNLTASIVRSFSTAQLKAYAQHILRGQKPGKLLHSKWVPGISKRGSEQYHKFTDTRNWTIRQSTKQQLARLIIKSGWDLTASTDAGIGEIDFLDAQGISFVKDESGSSVLDQIAATRRVTIEPITERVLRITGAKELAMAALRDITERDVQEVVLYLNVVRMHASPGNATKGEIKMTDQDPTSSGTSIKHLAKPTDISGTAAGFISHAAISPITTKDLQALKSVTGVSGKFTAEHPVRLKLKGYSTEQMEDARRMLYSISNLHTRSKTQYTCIEALSRKSLESPQSNTGSLSYNVRKQVWARQSNPVVVDAAGRAQENPSEDSDSNGKAYANVYEKLITAESVISQPIVKSKLDTLWDGLHVSYSSRLGFVQHAKREGSAGSATSIFTPGVIYLPTVLSYLTDPGSALSTRMTSNTVSFIFRHDSAIDHKREGKPNKKGRRVKPHTPDALPEIRFTFGLPPSTSVTQTPDLKSVTARCVDHNIAVSMPDNPIDFEISLARVESLNLKHGATTTLLEPIIQKMHKSISGSGRLRASSTIEIPVPQAWTNQRQTFDRWPDDAFPGHYTASYCFVGVEHKQSIPFDFHGQPATYEVVEGGKLAGTWSQLKVDVVPPQDGFDDDARATARKQAVVNGARLVDTVKKAGLGLLKYDKTEDLNKEVVRVAERGDHQGAATYARRENQDQVILNSSEGVDMAEEFEVEKRAAAGY